MREGKATLLIGVADENAADVLSIIRTKCHTRTKHVSRLPPIIDSEETYTPMPINVQVGGAVVFIVDVERFERF